MLKVCGSDASAAAAVVVAGFSVVKAAVVLVVGVGVGVGSRWPWVLDHTLDGYVGRQMITLVCASLAVNASCPTIFGTNSDQLLESYGALLLRTTPKTGRVGHSGRLPAPPYLVQMFSFHHTRDSLSLPYCCMDTVAWILLHGYCCMDTVAWTLLYGYCCMEEHTKITPVPLNCPMNRQMGFKMRNSVRGSVAGGVPRMRGVGWVGRNHEDCCISHEELLYRLDTTSFGLLIPLSVPGRKITISSPTTFSSVQFSPVQVWRRTMRLRYETTKPFACSAQLNSLACSHHTHRGGNGNVKIHFVWGENIANYFDFKNNFSPYKM